MVAQEHGAYRNGREPCSCGVVPHRNRCKQCKKIEGCEATTTKSREARVRQGCRNAGQKETRRFQWGGKRVVQPLIKEPFGD